MAQDEQHKEHKEQKEGRREEHDQATKLTAKRCVPCEGGVPRLSRQEVNALLPQVPGWDVRELSGLPHQLTKRFEWDDFKAAIAFVNRLAELAESEGHHPDFAVRYSIVDVTVYTHAISGLSENDFILAAKIDQAQASINAPPSR